MKKIWFCLCLLIAILLGTASCVQDNGNYSYIDINEVLVDFPTNYSRVYLSDTVLRVEPKLTQTLSKDESNLSFIWKYSQQSVANAKNYGDTISTGRYVDQPIHAKDTKFNHYYWLEITDNTTGLVYPFYTTITVLKPFINTWTVLHADGASTKLGAIEYILESDPIEHLDVFGEFGHPPLTGAPIALGADNYDQAVLGNDLPTYLYNLLYLVTTNANESGAYAPWLKFKNYLPDIFIPQMVYNYNSSYFDVSKTTYMYKTNGDGGVAINNNRLFQGGNGLKLYEARIAPAVGAVSIDKALRVGRITLMFDDLGKRFLWYNNAGNGTAPASGGKYSYTVGYFYETEENKSEILELERPLVNTISLNNIEHRVLHIGIGYKTSESNYQYIKSYAIANDGTNSKTYIYLFPTTYVIAQSSSNKSIDELKVIDTPAGLNENSCFASSVAYNNIAFYSSGSSVYRLDFGTGVATKIYEHSAGGVIVKMEMAKQESALSTSQSYDTEAYGFPLNRSLGIAINRGVSGELAVLNLNEAGAPVQTTVFSGFGSIKDICFLSDIKK